MTEENGEIQTAIGGLCEDGCSGMGNGASACDREKLGMGVGDGVEEMRDEWGKCSACFPIYKSGKRLACILVLGV